MTKTQAVAKLNETVFYLPRELPSEITWQTPIPSGTLTRLSEKKAKPNDTIITRNWGVVNNQTVPLDELYTTAKLAQAALKRRYLDQVPIAETAAVDYAVLADATDAIGIDPNPPPEPEPIE